MFGRRDRALLVLSQTGGGAVPTPRHADRRPQNEMVHDGICTIDSLAGTWTLGVAFGLAAGEPGDAPFHHGSVLLVVGSHLGVGVPAGPVRALDLVVDVSR